METEEANLSVILAEAFSTRQMPSLYQKITVIPEKYCENSDLHHFKWGLYGLVICLVYLGSRNGWKRCPGMDILEHAKFQRDVTFALLIIKRILSQMHSHACACVCVHACVHA